MEPPFGEFPSAARETIPATVQDADPLLEELIEIEENLISNRLSPIQEANHLVRWEELLTQLGRRATSGDNRWNRSGLTNDDLAKSRGVSKRTLQNTRSIANLNPEVQDIIESGEYEYNKMDLVALAKESDEVQLEVANLIACSQCKAFKRALQVARCKILTFDWDEEKARLREQVGKPFSVMKWNGDSSPLSQLCRLVSQDEECADTKKSWGTVKVTNYSQHPDHSAFFINTTATMTDSDCFAGRGATLVGAALGRKVVGDDLSPQNPIDSVCVSGTHGHRP